MEPYGERSSRFWAAYVLVLVALIVGTSPARAEEVGVTADTIKIGVSAPFTGSLATSWGYPMSRGASLVYDAVNAAGGIHGRKLVVVDEDDQCDPTMAVAAVKKLIHSQKVFLLHGSVCSNAALAIRPEVQREKLPWIVMGATALDVYVPTAPSIFGVLVTSDIHAKLISDFVMTVPSVKRIAIITHRDAWGLSRYDPLIKRFQERSNPALVADETLDRGANDSTPQTLRLKAANPDVVIVNLYPKEAAIFLRDTVKYGLKPVFVLVIEDIADVIAKAGTEEVAKTLYATTQLRHPMGSAELAPFEQRFKSRYPDTSLSTYTWWAYAGAEVVVEALRRAGRDLTREKFIKELEQLRGFESAVFADSFNFSPEDHRGNSTVNFVAYKNGRVILIGPKYGPIP